MASVRERVGRDGASTWAVLYRDAGKQRSKTFLDETRALRHKDRIDRLGLAAAVRILNAEEGTGADKMPTVAEQVQRHIDGLSGVQAFTVTTYTTMRKQLELTALGSLPLDMATRDDVAAWIREQETAGVSAKTIKNRQSLLSAALARAAEDQLVPRNVAARARIARTERREMTTLTPGEFQILLGRAGAHYRPLLMWLYGTGMRLGEATAIQVGDVHLEQKPPTVTVARAWKKSAGLGAPKTAAGRRTLSLPPQVVDAVKPLMAGRAAGDLLFVNTAGRRILQASLHDLWQEWIADWDIDRATGEKARRSPALGKVPRIHDLRHSHAAFMIGRGISLYDLKRRLGHESIQTTADTYGHLMPEAQVQAERAAALAFPKGPEQTEGASARAELLPGSGVDG